MAKITIATSLIPRNFELQRKAIDSWLSHGFKIVSVNSEEEAAIVGKRFPDIPVETVTRTSEAITGKPYVFFDDVLSTLLCEESTVCGIVNSDIFLVAKPGFMHFVESMAKQGLVFGSRIDVDSLDDLDGEKFIYGFDFFFCKQSVLELFPKSEFCLGSPWWDYWMPSVPLLKGEKCMELISPVAFHLKHETKWASNLFTKYGQLFAGTYSKLKRDQELFDGRLLVESPEAMTMFSFDVLSMIQEKSKKIVYPDISGSDHLIEVGRTQYLAMRKRVVEYHRKCIELQQLCNRLVVLAEMPGQLQEVYSSLSWRITKPLRWLGDKVRGIAGSK